MFSVKGNGELYARTDNGNPGGSVETHLGTALLGSSHRYTVEWTANKVDFYVDGGIVASHAVSFGATQMRPLFSEFNAGGGNLSVDWVRMSPHSNRDQSIAGHGDAGELYIKDGFFRFRHMDKTVTSSVAVKPGEWQQVVGVWDGVDIKIYVDGVEAGSVEQTKRPSSVSTFYVGYGELAPWFRGSIDEVAYYDRALNRNRVYQHFLADPPPSESGDAGRPGDPKINPPGTDPPVPPVDPTDPPVPPVDPTDPPVDPVDPTDPPVDPVDPPVVDPPVDPTDPEVTPTAACLKADADLAKAQKKLKAAKKKAKHAKGKAAKKKAKAKVRLAQLQVSKAKSVSEARC